MDDISNIRVTEANNAFLKRLTDEESLFAEDKIAAIFAIAYAINNDLDLTLNGDYSIPSPTVNKWDAASIDPAGIFRLLVQIRHANVECPFRVLQAVMNLGLEKMRKEAPDTGFVKISSFIKNEENNEI